MFVPGLLAAAALFFAVNCWILGVVVADAGAGVGLADVSGSGIGAQSSSRNEKKTGTTAQRTQLSGTKK